MIMLTKKRENKMFHFFNSFHFKLHADITAQ